MPEFYSTCPHGKYWGFWGFLRLLFDPQPPVPPPSVGAVELPTRITRSYTIQTPAGFPCAYEVDLELSWAQPLECGCRVRLSKEEVDEALAAWEEEIRNPALANSFLAYT